MVVVSQTVTEKVGRQCTVHNSRFDKYRQAEAMWAVMRETVQDVRPRGRSARRWSDDRMD